MTVAAGPRAASQDPINLYESLIGKYIHISDGRFPLPNSNLCESYVDIYPMARIGWALDRFGIASIFVFLDLF